MKHEAIYAARQEQIKKQRELMEQLSSQKIVINAQLLSIDYKLTKENTRLEELEKSTAFITGMITALNEAFDMEVEKAKQSGFELGYSTHKKEVKDPKKPLPIESSVRKKRLDKRKEKK